MPEVGFSLEMPDSKAQVLSSGFLFKDFFFFFLIPIPQMSNLSLQKLKQVVPGHMVGQQLSQDGTLGLYDLILTLMKSNIPILQLRKQV